MRVPPPLAKAQTRFLSSTGVSRALGNLRAPLETGVLAESPADAAQIPVYGVPHEFYFSRVAYSGYGGFYGRGGSWQTDFPKADQIFLSFIDRLLPNLDAYLSEFVVLLDEPDLRRFPFLYALEVGSMSLSPPEIEGLRSYLLQGGFLVIDDFWGTQQWAQFEYEIRQVLPEYEIVDLPLDHNVFTTFYEIDEVIQVPNVGNGTRGGPYLGTRRVHSHGQGDSRRKGSPHGHYQLEYRPGRRVGMGGRPYYPFEYSKYAYEMGVNFIVYAMSH